MGLVVVGLSYADAPVHVRGRYARLLEHVVECCFAAGQQEEHAFPEMLVLSTCNRVEWVAYGHQDNSALIAQGRGFFEELGSLDVPLYTHQDGFAVQHLMGVACGLESQVLGEAEIFGQVKVAYETSKRAGLTGKHLNRLFQHSFAVCKRVRTETGVGLHARSVASVAVKLALQIFETLASKRVLLIGAGETVRLLAQHLKRHGIHQLSIANRSIERADELARALGAASLSLDELPQALSSSDIIFSATGGDEVRINKTMMQAALHRKRSMPVLMVDLAVPRDMAPDLAELDHVYVYDMDDLSSIIDENEHTRATAAKIAWEMIREHAEVFMRWLATCERLFLLVDYRQRALKQRDRAVLTAQRALQRGEDPLVVMEQLADRLTKQLIHIPTLELKRQIEQLPEEISHEKQSRR